MNRKSKFTQPATALYCRLSIEDGRDNESISISNQELLYKGWFHHILLLEIFILSKRVDYTDFSAPSVAIFPPLVFLRVRVKFCVISLTGG